jgi:hypothetical protein
MFETPGGENQGYFILKMIRVETYLLLWLLVPLGFGFMEPW